MTSAIIARDALLLATVSLVPWFNGSSTRSAMNQSIADAGDRTPLRRIRCHGDFAVWVSVVLILMLLVALPGADAVGEPAYGNPNFAAMMKAYFNVNELMKAAGHPVAGQGRQAVETATSQRIKSGIVGTMDGPFAATKAHLGGNHIMDVPDLDTAPIYAARIPSAAFGTVTLHPQMSCTPAT